LQGRRATTHWNSASLLPHFGATLAESRVVIDGDLISTSGVTAGIDGALHLAALLAGEEVAQQIQLEMQYAPEPPFSAGTPDQAPKAVRERSLARFAPLTERRRALALRVASRLLNA
jgi:cyclohexyl-isocyanide hydratase